MVSIEHKLASQDTRAYIAMVTLGEGGMRVGGLDGGMKVQRGRSNEGDWDWDELLVLH